MNGLTAEEKLLLLQEEEAEQQAMRVQKSREGKTRYKQVEIDVTGKTTAEEIVEFAKKSLHITNATYKRTVNHCYTVTIEDISPGELNAIKRRLMIDRASKTFFSAANGGAKAIIGVADFAAQKVVVPVAKATLKATAGVVKVGGKTILQAGSIVVNSAADSYNETKEELSRDKDVLEAGENLKSLWNKTKNLFSSNDDKNPNIRVIK